MKRRQVTIAALVGAVVAGACLDMSAPKGPASISLLILPSSSIVVNDVMRDSLGNPATLSINAFDAAGNLIPNLAQTFFITDSAPVANFVAPGLLRGDTLGTVHVVGQIAGVQTPVAPIVVTVAPAALDSTSQSPDTLKAPNVGDTTQVGAVRLGVTLVGVNPGTGSQGFPIRWVLVSAPISLPNASSPAVFLSTSQGAPTNGVATGVGGSVLVTTGVGGTAQINLVVVAARVGDTTLTNGGVDSAVVTASASYKGALVTGSPLKFVVPIKLVSPP